MLSREGTHMMYWAGADYEVPVWQVEYLESRHRARGICLDSYHLGKYLPLWPVTSKPQVTRVLRGMQCQDCAFLRTCAREAIASCTSCPPFPNR